MPLFGAHFLMSPLVMCESSKGAEYVNIFNKLVESSQVCTLIILISNFEIKPFQFQGSIVALIFCFSNKDVRMLFQQS